MNRIYVSKENNDFEQKKIFVEGSDVKHLTKVLRVQIGEKIEVCDGNCNEYIGEIASISSDSVEIDIIEKNEITREPNLKVVLYQGLPKGPKMEIILQKATELGVDEIVLVDTARTVVKLDKKVNNKIDRWQRIIYEAAKQCKRGKLPKLRGVLSFEQCLKDMAKNDFNISPYEDENSQSIKQILSSGKCIESLSGENKKIGIFIGPEGGFEPFENENIKISGISSVTLGPRILRTETASIATIAVVLYEFGEMGGK